MWNFNVQLSSTAIAVKRQKEGKNAVRVFDRDCRLLFEIRELPELILGTGCGLFGGGFSFISNGDPVSTLNVYRVREGFARPWRIRVPGLSPVLLAASEDHFVFRSQARAGNECQIFGIEVLTLGFNHLSIGENHWLDPNHSTPGKAFQLFLV